MKNYLKYGILLCALVIVQLSFSQYREFFDEFPFPYIQQTSSVYKANKVKKRYVYTVAFGKSSLEYMAEMDREGRVIHIALLQPMSMYKRDIYFEYNTTMQLSSAYDIYTKSKDGKFYQEFVLGDKEMMEKFKNAAPKRKVAYQVHQVSDSLMTIYRIEEQQNDTLSYSTYHTNTGVHQYKDFDKYGAKFSMQYQTIENFEFVPLQLVHKDKKRHFYYKLNEKQQIIYLVFESYSGEDIEPYNKEDFLLEYNSKGLMQKMGNVYSNYIYEYEYY